MQQREIRISAVVYVCHPFRADQTEAREAVRLICRRLVSDGHLPLAPQLFLPEFLSEATERDLAMSLCLDLVSLATEVRVYGEPTEGMQLEIAEAERLKILVVCEGRLVSRGGTHKRLGFFGALFPYLGGKRRLCPLIFREIDKLLPRRLWPGRRLLDGFLGGGSIALFGKALGFNITATDIAERSIVVGRALIENSRVRLTREDVLRLLTPIAGSAGRIEREMVPAIFTKNLARFIDKALSLANNTADPAKSALIRMLAIRLALLEHPMSQVRKGTIHRVATGEYESITESCVHHYVEGMRLSPA